MSMTKEPWQQEHPNYEGWLAEYGGKVWGETGEILHPPTEEGKVAAEYEAQEFQDYYASKTDDEDYIQELYSFAQAVELGNTVEFGFTMCDCCDWGYGPIERSA
jgi:hypothetical protein